MNREGVQQGFCCSTAHVVRVVAAYLSEVARPLRVAHAQPVGARGALGIFLLLLVPSLSSIAALAIVGVPERSSGSMGTLRRGDVA